MLHPEPFRSPIELFFDGACPLCSREVAWIRRHDHRGAIRFTDISSPNVAGLPASRDVLMEKIHARLGDGTLIEGVEVFRRVYEAIGFRRSVKLTRLPVVAPLLDALYSVFAKNRLRLTGRCDETCGVAP